MLVAFSACYGKQKHQLYYYNVYFRFKLFLAFAASAFVCFADVLRDVM